MARITPGLTVGHPGRAYSSVDNQIDQRFAANKLHAELKAKLGASVENCTCNPTKGNCKDCAPWRRELETYYTGDVQRIGWSNCTPSKWSKEPWEVAKVFMPKGKTADNTGPEKSDASALLNFLVHCKYCKQYVSVNPAEKVIEVRNETMHSKDLTFGRQTFNEYMDKMDRLLRLVKDPLTLAADITAKEAADEILKIKKGEFHIGPNKTCLDAEIRVLREFMGEQEKLLQLHEEQLEDHGTRLDTLEKSIPPVEEVLQTVGPILDIVNNNPDLQQFLKDQAMELSTITQQLQDRLGKVEETVAEHGAQISDVQERLDQLEVPSRSTTFSPDETSAFTNALTTNYSNALKTLKPLPWDDRFCLDLDKIFTHLVLIGHQGHEARRVFESLDDVFDHQPESGQSKRFNVLVVGDAGSGKSTLLSKTALDWSCEKGRLADMNKIVLLIRLREVEPGESIAQIVWDQCITKSAKGISISSIETCLQDYESDVVFLLDGYDELVPDAKGPKQAVPELLAKTWYPDCTIIVTSRPSSGVSASRLHPREQLNFPHKSMQEFLAARFAADRVNTSDDLHSLVPLDTVSAVLQQKNLVQFICGCGGKAAGELLSSLNRLYVANDSNKTLKHLCLMSLYECNDSQHFPILSTMLSSLDVHITIPCREGAALKYYLDHAKAMPEGISLKLTLLEERDGDAVEYLSCLVEKTLSDALGQILPKLTMLEKLDISHNSIGDKGKEPFAAIQQPVASPKVLDLSNTKIGDVCLRSLAAVLHHLSCLEDLDLSRNNIGHDGLEPFAAIQQPVASLKELDLSHNKIGDVCVGSLAAVLHHLSCLEKLYLHENNIGNEGLEPFAAIQQPVASLKVLNLYHNKIGDVCVGSLAAVLHHLSCLEKLSLSHNNIGHDGLEPFAAIQQPVVSLKELDLSHNKIGDVCARSLAVVLRHLSCLKTLALSHNNIRDVGVASFAATFHHAPCLEYVYLGHNPVTAVGLQRFAETIHRMSALKGLSLDLSPQQTVHLDDTTAMSICTILTRLPVLTHLYLCNISLHAAGFQAVVTAVEEHPTFEALL
ncbi:hypothetical protein Bbelb_089030 [Branchiostoma belcheri]|nr:hypothetical protein Bbelb_089030 [Branchiostoma belcheri]